MKSRKKPSTLNLHKILSQVGNKTSVENKINHLALLLGYIFEYGIDFERRIINLTGEIDERQFDIIDAGLTIMESQGRKDITIKINSPGGSSYQAMAIVGRMKESKKRGVHIVTKGYGHVMSAATLILANGTRRREMSEDAFFMWHEASYELDGRHSENKKTVAQVDKEEKFWAQRMSELTKKDLKWWFENGVGTDAYFNAEQLMKLGVVDELF